MPRVLTLNFSFVAVVAQRPGERKRERERANDSRRVASDCWRHRLRLQRHFNLNACLFRSNLLHDQRLSSFFSSTLVIFRMVTKVMWRTKPDWNWKLTESGGERSFVTAHFGRYAANVLRISSTQLMIASHRIYLSNNAWQRQRQ